VAHNIARECKPRRLGHGPAIARLDDPERPHGTYSVICHIFPREYGDDARLSESRNGIDTGYSRMRMRRAQKDAMQSTGPGDIRDKTTMAEQKPAILDAPQGSANALVISHNRLLQLLAEEVEPLEGGFVGDHEKVRLIRSCFV
jgi:hypothetical protein